MINTLVFEDAQRLDYLVIMEEENHFLVNVWWSINLPNNPTPDEILEDFVKENFGDKKFEYFYLNDAHEYETGALKYLYPDMF